MAGRPQSGPVNRFVLVRQAGIRTGLHTLSVGRAVSAVRGEAGCEESQYQDAGNVLIIKNQSRMKSPDTEPSVRWYERAY